MSSCVITFLPWRFSILRGHHERSHSMERNDIEEGVHYMPVGMQTYCVVEMVEEGGQVTFKVPDAGLATL